MKIVTERLDLIPIWIPSLEYEKMHGVPDLPGIITKDWPPEHWEPHVFDWIAKQYAERPDTFGWHRYIVLRLPTPALVGNLGAHPRPDGDVEFGYSVLPEYHGKGIATEAARAFVDWLSTQAGVNSISAQTFPSLPASIRVMVKCGLSHVGAGDEDGTIRYQRLILPRSS